MTGLEYLQVKRSPQTLIQVIIYYIFICRRVNDDMLYDLKFKINYILNSRILLNMTLYFE